MNIQNFDTKSTMSIGTESNLSESSYENQNGGNIFSYLFGSDKSTYISDILFDAFESNNPEAAAFILRNAITKKYDIDFSKKSETSKTILHYLVLYSNYVSEIKQLLIDMLQSTDIKKYINQTDAKGNTVGHYALYLNMEDVLELLIQYGVDLTIKNNSGYNISPITSKSSLSEPSDIFQKIIKKSSEIEESDDNDDSKIINSKSCKNTKSDNSVQLLKIIRRFIPESVTSTIGFDSDVSESASVKSLPNILSPTSPDISEKSQQIFLSPTSPDVSKKSESNFLSTTSDVITDDIVNILLNEFNTKENKTEQLGGKGNRNGKRRIANYSETYVDTDSSSEGELSGLYKMARAIENKSSEAHKNAVERIKELLKVSEDEAKAYKAIIYDMIKNEQPELSNYDRAMELEKRASDEKVLKKINKSDVKQMMKNIEQRKLEKSSSVSSSSTSSTTSSSSTTSDTTDSKPSKSSKSSKSSKLSKSSDKPKKTKKKKDETSESSFFETTSSIQID